MNWRVPTTQRLGLEPLMGQLSKQASRVCVTAGGWGIHLGCLTTVKV